jgi:Fe-S-cluster containining protein
VTASAARGRSCGTCTLCCKLLLVPELNKPMGTWCAHCKQGEGCGIHETRPQACRDFFCGYLQTEQLSEEWHPVKSRIVVAGEPSGIVLYVDPGRPDAWRGEPFYARIKAWATDNLPRNRLVTVRIGKRTVAVLPDKDVDLGEMKPGDTIAWEARRGPLGRVWSAWRVKKPTEAGA